MKMRYQRGWSVALAYQASVPLSRRRFTRLLAIASVVNEATCTSKYLPAAGAGVTDSSDTLSCSSVVEEVDVRSVAVTGAGAADAGALMSAGVTGSVPAGSVSAGSGGRL